MTQPNMNVYAVVLLVGVAVFPIAAEEVVTNGTCPATTVVSNFNETQYAGQWYEVKRFPNTLVSDSCANPIYNWSASTRGYNVTYPRNSKLKYELRRQSVVPVAGRYDVYVGGKKEVIPYTVLLTDYRQYSVVWGCTYRSSNNTNIQRLSVLSRKTTLDKSIFASINATLTNWRINTTKLRDIPQDDKSCKRKVEVPLEF